MHGFSGNWESTWCGDASSAFFDLIAQDPDVADYDVFAFGYRTSFFRGDQVESVASQLHGVIRLKLATYQLVLLSA